MMGQGLVSRGVINAGPLAIDTSGAFPPILQAVSESDRGKVYIGCTSLITSRNLANPFADLVILTNGGTQSGIARSVGAFPNPLPIVDGQRGAYLTMRTTTILGNVFGLSWNRGPAMPANQGPVFVSYMRTPADITDLVLWNTVNGNAAASGITSSTTDPGAAGSGWAGFRYSAGIDAGWVGFTRSNTTNLISLTSVLQTVQANTEYLFIARRNITTGEWTFSVDNLGNQTISTNLPTVVAYMSVCGVRTNVAAIKEFGYGSDLIYLAGTN